MTFTTGLSEALGGMRAAVFSYVASGAWLVSPCGLLCLAYPGQISLAEHTDSVSLLSEQYSSYSCSIHVVLCCDTEAISVRGCDGCVKHHAISHMELEYPRTLVPRGPLSRGLGLNGRVFHSCFLCSFPNIFSFSRSFKTGSHVPQASLKLAM